MEFFRSRRLRDRPEDIEMQNQIMGRANYSMGILGKSFIYHGSGRYVSIRGPDFKYWSKRLRRGKNSYK